MSGGRDDDAMSDDAMSDDGGPDAGDAGDADADSTADAAGSARDDVETDHAQPDEVPDDAADDDETPDDEAADDEAPDDEADDEADDEVATSRWDRTPPPHDWRFFVNRTGRTLITLGLLMFGFVAYQLWGTGIQTARAQHRLEVQFEEALAAAGSTPEPSAAPSTTVPATTAPPTTVPTVTPTAPATPTTAPATTAPPTTAPPTSAPVAPEIAPGRALAKLEIPRIDKSLYVLPGVDVATLHDGPGHYPDTPLPGQLGNSAIAGHRTTSGAPFGDIDELEPGDELVVTMTTGDRFVYQVTESFIVDPSEYWVVRTEDPTVAMLTLTSCHPEYTASQRIVVRSILKPAESAPAGDPTFYELDEGDSDDTPTATSVVDGVPIPVTVPGEPATEDGGVETATGTDAASDGVASPSDDDLDGGPDGLTSGWFDDTAAWPHVIGWGVACLLLALGAARLSRRFRSYPIGIALVTLPFAVTLFFFYENVNRLLPAGL